MPPYKTQQAKKFVDIIDRTNIFSTENIGSLPERELWRQVLVVGLKDALSGDRSALRWLRIDNCHEPGQFLWICKELKIYQVELIRKIIAEGLKSPRTKKVFLELKKIHRINSKSKK